MSISCAGHLRAWLIEDVETQLQNQSNSTVVWAERLTGALLSGLTVPEIFLEASNYQSEQGFKRFLVWSLQNYPAETLEAVTRIIRQQEQADHAVHTLAYGTSYSGLPDEYSLTERDRTGAAAAQPGPKSGGGSS